MSAGDRWSISCIQVYLERIGTLALQLGQVESEFILHRLKQLAGDVEYYGKESTRRAGT